MYWVIPPVGDVLITVMHLVELVVCWTSPQVRAVKVPPLVQSPTDMPGFDVMFTVEGTTKFARSDAATIPTRAAMPAIVSTSPRVVLKIAFIVFSPQTLRRWIAKTIRQLSSGARRAHYHIL
jgi:hypothetical protein